EKKISPGLLVSWSPGLAASRRFLSATILIVSAVLVIRAVLVEPFGVATGSMALTLLGAHRAADCPRCGFPVRVGAPPDGAPSIRYYAEACCPNCGQGDLGLER